MARLVENRAPLISPGIFSCEATGGEKISTHGQGSRLACIHAFVPDVYSGTGGGVIEGPVGVEVEHEHNWVRSSVGLENRVTGL